jgi:hypothetical protein
MIILSLRGYFLLRRIWISSFDFGSHNNKIYLYRSFIIMKDLLYSNIMKIGPEFMYKSHILLTTKRHQYFSRTN